MAKQDDFRTLYQSAFDRVRAPEELLRKVENMNMEQKPKKHHKTLRRTAVAVAAVVALFILSNAVALVVTGETWVGRIWDENPNRPMENVQTFFLQNAARFGEKAGNARTDYYGGTYLDGDTQVILLTDLSESENFIAPCENVRFELCTYTYAELTDGIDVIGEALFRLRRDGIPQANDIIAWGLDDKDNRVVVTVYRLDDTKLQWFKENVSDAGYLVFENTDIQISGGYDDELIPTDGVEG